jgi:hypothetical protein
MLFQFIFQTQSFWILVHVNSFLSLYLLPIIRMSLDIKSTNCISCNLVILKGNCGHPVSRPCSSSPDDPVVTVEPVPCCTCPMHLHDGFFFLLLYLLLYTHLPLCFVSMWCSSSREWWCAFRQVLAILVNLIDLIVFHVAWLRFLFIFFCVDGC